MSHVKSVLRELAVRANSMGSVQPAVLERMIHEAAHQLATVRDATESEQVYQFQTKMHHVFLCGDGSPVHLVAATSHPRHLTGRKLIERASFLQEELDEFLEAAGLERDEDGLIFEKIEWAPQDLAEMADALVDLVYVAKGTANLMGLPWEELWNDVHRANMAKEPGEAKRGGRISARDAIKPEGWKPPQSAEILRAAGYEVDHHAHARWDDPEFSPGGLYAVKGGAR